MAGLFQQITALAASNFYSYMGLKLHESTVTCFESFHVVPVDGDG